MIITRWKVLPREQCNGIKDFIVELIIQVSQDEEKSEKEKVYLHKLNMILVQILKQEWPKNWPTFISGIFLRFSCERNLGEKCMKPCS